MAKQYASGQSYEAKVSGMKFLPQVVEVPSFLKTLGFDQIPAEHGKVRGEAI